MPDALTLDVRPVATAFSTAMQRYSQRVQTDGATAVRTHMTAVRQVLIMTSPVDTGYLQAHWGPVEEASTGMLIAFRVENPTPYGPILEYGGYCRVGPKTVALAGGDLGAGFMAEAGIYSQQAPLGFVRKALAGSWQPFQARLWRVVREAWPYTSSETAPLSGDLSTLFGIDLGGDSGGTLNAGTQHAVHEVLETLRSRRGRVNGRRRRT